MSVAETVNLSDLSYLFAEEFHISTKKADEILDIIISQLSDQLEKKQRIEIRGFGCFEVRTRAPRKARNPKTGETVQTSINHSIHFKPGKTLKELVNDTKS